MKTCIHSVHVFLTWSTSVHWLQSWKIMFKKFNCIVRGNGDRFLIIWRQTLLANSPHCGICSTKELGRDLSSCLRVFLQKDYMSGKSRATIFFFTAPYHSEALEMTGYPGQDVFSPCFGEGAVPGGEGGQGKALLV